MALATQTITSTQNPWVPNADYDPAHPIRLEIIGQSGAGENGGASGAGGGGGGGYARWNSRPTFNIPAACSFTIGSNITIIDSSGFHYVMSPGNPGSGGTGGLGGGAPGDLNDFTPDVSFLGGNGGNKGTTGGGGGGEAASASGAGANGSNGSTTTGGAGGTGGPGADGGAGGNATQNGTAGSSPGGGGGGGGSAANGGAAGTPQITITYTQLSQAQSLSGRANIVANGSVTTNPTYPYSTDNYAGSDLVAIRSLASGQSWIPSQGGGETKPNYLWRLTKNFSQVLAQGSGSFIGMPYAGGDSDPSYGSALRARYILDAAVNKSALMIGGNMTVVDSGTTRVASISGVSTGVITSGVLSATDHAGWNSYGIDTGTDKVLISNCSAGGVPGTYAITSISAANGLTLTSYGGSNCTCSYQVVKASDTQAVGSIAELAGLGYFNPLSGGGATGVVSGGQVKCFCIFNNELYIGGVFATLNNGLTVNNIAKWDGANWSAVGTTGVTGGEVDAMCVYGGKLYVGGTFTQAGGVSDTSKIAYWDGAAWNSARTGSLNSQVMAMISFGGNLIVGGSFTDTGISRLAKFDGTTWSAVCAGGAPSSSVRCFAAYSGQLAIGGSFTTANGAAANTYKRVMLWDGASTFTALSTGAATGSVLTICAFSGNLYAGGSFAVIGATTVNGVGYWDGAAWNNLGSRTGTAGDQPNAMVVHDGKLIIGGSFTQASGNAGNYIFSWDGTTSAAVGTGTQLDAPVNALIEFPLHWACATICKGFLGLCAAYGIPVRMIGSTDPVGNGDTLVEVYDYRNRKWVFFYVHMYNWVENSGGVPQSGKEIKTANDTSGITVTASGSAYNFAAAGGSGLVPQPSANMQATQPPKLATKWWCGLTADLPTAAGRQFWIDVCDYTNKFNNSSPTEAGVNVANGASNPTVAWDAASITYKLNEIQANSALIMGSFVRISFTNGMDDASHGFDFDHYEFSTDNGSTWNNLAGTPSVALNATNVYDWTPGASSANLYIRGIAVSGVISPSVIVAYTTSEMLPHDYRDQKAPRGPHDYRAGAGTLAYEYMDQFPRDDL